MILLAPVRATGGIASWARQVVANWPSSVTVVDTSPWLRKPSQALNSINAPVAFFVGACIWIRAIILALFSGDAIWVTVAPSIGFRVRDVVFFRLCSRIKVRTVLHVHGSLVSGLTGTSSLSRSWATKGIRAAGEVVVLDVRTQKEIQHITGRLPVKIPNFIGLPPGPSGSSPGSGKVLYVGRVCKEKGSDVLVEIADTLVGEQRLTVVGPIDPAIERSFRDSCAGLNVEIAGEVDPQAVRDWMKACDLLVLPSQHEGFPMVVLEAMSLGVPVVAADVGACREMLVDGPERVAGTIRLNPMTDGGRDLVSGVIELLSDPSRLVELNGGRERVLARYTAARVTPMMLSILEGA